jgi:hypothetical protein
VEGDQAARILCQTVPAGEDHGPLEGTGQASLLGPAALELETLADLAARYQIDVLGPLPQPFQATQDTPVAARATERSQRKRTRRPLNV